MVTCTRIYIDMRNIYTYERNSGLKGIYVQLRDFFFNNCSTYKKIETFGQIFFLKKVFDKFSF